jgi:transposase
MSIKIQPTAADLLSYILPNELFQYFTLTKVEEQNDNLHFYLEEKNILPSEFSGRRLESKGFHAESIIRDFPLRGRPMYLHVRRRRWLDLDSGLVVSRDWNAVAKGTQHTQEFASFLKELVGFIPDFGPLS